MLEEAWVELRLAVPTLFLKTPLWQAGNTSPTQKKRCLTTERAQNSKQRDQSDWGLRGETWTKLACCLVE